MGLNIIIGVKKVVDADEWYPEVSFNYQRLLSKLRYQFIELCALDTIICRVAAASR